MTRRQKPADASPPDPEPPASGRWTSWKPFPGGRPLSAETLAEVLDGGQAFRWNSPAPGLWEGIWADAVARLTCDAAGNLLWSAPQSLEARVEIALAGYLAHAGRPALADSLPWRSDPHLADCVRSFPGLFLLNQPFGETLLAFLCSSTKQIVQIKQICRHLASRFGPAIIAGFHALPSWSRLAEVSEKDLRSCLLGFRARYIKETADRLAAEPGWLAATAALPYAEAKARLLTLPGVGEKIADCVLLFGASRMEAFPVDTWILKTLERRYGLAGWTPRQLAQFGRAHFGPLAGLAQQYLFAYERRLGRGD